MNRAEAGEGARRAPTGPRWGGETAAGGGGRGDRRLGSEWADFGGRKAEEGVYVSSRSEDSRRGTDRKWRGGPSQGLCVAKHISHQQRPTTRLSLYRLHHRREPSSSPSTASTARRSPSTPAFTRTKPAPAPALRLPAPATRCGEHCGGACARLRPDPRDFHIFLALAPASHVFPSTTSPLTQLTSASPAPLRRNLFAAALLFYPADTSSPPSLLGPHHRPRFPSLPPFAITNSPPSRRLPSTGPR